MNQFYPVADEKMNAVLNECYKNADKCEIKLYHFAAWLAVLASGLGVILLVGNV